MRDDLRTNLTKAAIDMYDSLVTAIEKAGGSYDKDELLNMSVLDLISRLSTNSIRFVYNGPTNTCPNCYSQHNKKFKYKGDTEFLECLNCNCVFSI